MLVQEANYPTLKGAASATPAPTALRMGGRCRPQHPWGSSPYLKNLGVIAQLAARLQLRPARCSSRLLRGGNRRRRILLRCLLRRNVLRHRRRRRRKAVKRVARHPAAVRARIATKGLVAAFHRACTSAGQWGTQDP